MTDNAHDRRTLEERLQWIADWSEPGIDLADAGTAREALDRIKSQAIRIRELEAERQRLITENNVLTNERDALKAEVARLRETNGILEDGLQEVGDDYPGSSCQEWCQQQVMAARARRSRRRRS